MLQKIFSHLYFEDPEDPNKDTAGGNPDDDGNGGNQGDNPGGDTGKKYTDADLDRFKVQWKAQWQKKFQKEQAEKDEAAKLANMTEAEKNEHELAKLRTQVAELTAEKTKQGLTNTARQICRDAGVNVSEAVLARLIGEDADTTSANVKAYIADFQSAVQAETKAKLSHKPPQTGSAGTITRSDIEKIEDWKKRQAAIKQHPELFTKKPRK